MSAAPVYSERLGAIADAQFAAAASRLGLGRFLSAAPVPSGLFGQNVFMTTSAGEFVLRGAPHWVRGAHERAYRPNDRWQFTKEKFFVDQLHQRTSAPVPWPYLHDEASDIFGWPYIIMPRMPGACYDERTILTALGPEDRRAVAAALGAMLNEMQRLTAPFAGDFDVDAVTLIADPAGAVARMIAEARGFAGDAQAHGAMTADDMAWLEDAYRGAEALASRPNTYVHCDYKLNNLTLTHEDGAWRVSGLFDFHEARFGDGALDLVRQACAYLDTEPALARVFAEAYCAGRAPDPALARLTPLYVVNDRLKFWVFFTRPPARARWTAGVTFRGWAEPYVAAMAALV